MWNFAIPCLFLSAVAASPHVAARRHMIRRINAMPGLTWTAGENARFTGNPVGWSKSLCGVLKGSEKQLIERVRDGEVRVTTSSNVGVPRQFDSATHWPKCARVINDIRDQSNCGCCWAFAPASAASDRLCIATDGAFVLPLSAQELCFCAKRGGCNGGFADQSWSYIIEHGLVTGGQQAIEGNGTNPDVFAGQRFCSKFSLPHCHHHGPRRDDPFAAEGDATCPHVDSVSSPSCPSSCDTDAPSHHSSFLEDRYRLAHGHVAWVRGSHNIAQALVTGGPLSASLDIYEDFENYVGGVYKHVVGSLLGAHEVRMVGYGVTDEGVEYWKIANSWNPYWGEHGFFRILRGVNHCKVESEIIVAVGGAWSKGKMHSLEQLERGHTKQLRSPKQLRQGHRVVP